MLTYFIAAKFLFITNDTHLDTTKELVNFLSCQSLPDEDLKRSEPWDGCTTCGFKPRKHDGKLWFNMV